MQTNGEEDSLSFDEQVRVSDKNRSGNGRLVGNKRRKILRVKEEKLTWTVRRWLLGRYKRLGGKEEREHFSFIRVQMGQDRPIYISVFYWERELFLIGGVRVRTLSRKQAVIRGR